MTVTSHLCIFPGTSHAGVHVSFLYAFVSFFGLVKKKSAFALRSTVSCFCFLTSSCLECPSALLCYWTLCLIPKWLQKDQVARHCYSCQFLISSGKWSRKANSHIKVFLKLYLDEIKVVKKDNISMQKTNTSKWEEWQKQCATQTVVQMQRYS